MNKMNWESPRMTPLAQHSLNAFGKRRQRADVQGGVSPNHNSRCFYKGEGTMTGDSMNRFEQEHLNRPQVQCLW